MATDSDAVGRALAAMVADGQAALLSTKLVTVCMGNAVWPHLGDVEAALEEHRAAARRILDSVEDAMVDGTGCRLAVRVVARLLLGAQHYHAALNTLCMPWFVTNHMDADDVVATSMDAMRSAAPGKAVLTITLLVDDVPARAMTVSAAAARDDPAVAEAYRDEIRAKSPYTHTWATVFTARPDGTPVANIYMAFSEHYTLAGWLGLDAAADDVVAHMSPGLKPMFRDTSLALVRRCPYRGTLPAHDYAAFLNDVAIVGGVHAVDSAWVAAYRRAFAVDMATLKGQPAAKSAKRFSFHAVAFDVDTLPDAVAEVERVEDEAGWK